MVKKCSVEVYSIMPWKGSHIVAPGNARGMKLYDYISLKGLLKVWLYAQDAGFLNNSFRVNIDCGKITPGVARGYDEAAPSGQE